MTVSADRFQKIEIIQRKDHAEDLWSIRVRPEQPLVYQPGQYATLALAGSAHPLERPYSIVSSPLENEIEFFFELVPHGGLTPALHKMPVGETLLMRRQAKGRFTFDNATGHAQHFMAATVTGVAPFVSMVRTLARQTHNGLPGNLRVVLLQAASRSWEFGYREELEALAADSRWFTYIPTISRPWEDPSWHGEVGRIEDILRKHLDACGLKSADATAYLCGQPQMIENSKEILQRRGFQKEFIRQEVYWVPKKEAK